MTPRITAVLALFASALAARAGTCPTCVPLAELGQGLYLGQYEGGLYPGGENVPPQAHLSAAMAQAQLVIPRDALGQPDPNGWIGLITFGMSNTTQEFSVFELDANENADRNARVVFVNTAQGGIAAEPMSDPNHSYWDQALERVASAGLDPRQVQVAWLKQAQTNPVDTFPAHAESLQAQLVAILHNARALFPNLRLCYVSSRIYGGYSTNSNRDEPLTYETAFAYKWMVEDQINGDPALHYDPQSGPVNAPLLLWGPYLWANGATPRADGLAWQQTDFEGDFIHPNRSGEQKVADLLNGFFDADPTAREWYARRPDATVVAFRATDDAWVRSDQPATNTGASAGLTIADQGGVIRRAYLRFDVSELPEREVLGARLVLRNSSGGGLTLVRRVPVTAWDESTITWNNAPGPGALVAQGASFSGGGTTDIDLSADAAGDDDGVYAYALEAQPGQTRTFSSGEGTDAPQLVLVLRGRLCDPIDFNNDGIYPDVADLDAFLHVFGGGICGPCGDIDFNNDGVYPDNADLTAYLRVFAGGPCLGP